MEIEIIDSRLWIVDSRYRYRHIGVGTMGMILWLTRIVRNMFLGLGFRV